MSTWPRELLAVAAFRRRVLPSLIVAFAIVAAAGLLLAGAVWQSLAAAREFAAAESQLAAAQSLHERLVLNDARDEATWRRFRALVAAGLFDSDRRAWWAEAAAARLRGLVPLEFDVELGAPHLEPLPADAQRWFDETGATAARLVSHDLRITVDGLHEGEVATLLEELVDPGNGAVRLEECVLSRRPDGLGLDTRCVLRFVTLHWPEA